MCTETPNTLKYIENICKSQNFNFLLQNNLRSPWGNFYCLPNSDTSKLGPKCDHVLNQKSWVAKLRFHICDYIFFRLAKSYIETKTKYERNVQFFLVISKLSTAKK